MIQFRKSIGFRLLGISFILLALPLLVDSFILVQKRYQHTISDAKEFLVEVANLREIPLSQLPPLDRPLVEVLIDYLKLERSFPQTPDAALDQKLKTLAEIGNFYAIFLIKIDPETGQYIVISSGKSDYLGKNFTDFFKLNDLYRPSVLEKGYAVFMTFNKQTGHPFFMIAHPIYSMKEGRYVGVLALSEDISGKIEQLLVREKRRYQVDFALLLPSSIVFEATDPSLKFQYFSSLKPGFKELFFQEEPIAAKSLAEHPLPVDNKIGFPFFEFTWKNQQQIGYLRKIPDASYSLLTYASKDEIFQTPLINFFNIYSIYGVILIVGGTLATFLTMRMAKPIQNLSVVMQKIQEGDLNYRYHIDPIGFEINDLGRIFNETVDAVLEQKHKGEEERIKRETLARELRVGQQVQRSLLPQKMPNYPGVDLSEIYIPTIEVGGDFYDIFIKEEKAHPKLVLAVADASGKGVSACFYSLSVRNMLRTYTKEYADIAEAMVATNNLFTKDTGDTGMFVTVLAGIYDYKTKVLKYYSCGHNPGLVHRENGTIELLKHSGMAMGVDKLGKAHADKIQLYKGDTVVFYTDGITEAHNEEYQFFGEDRLIECLKQEGSKAATVIVNSIVGSVNAFAGAASQHDDITLLVMKIIE